MPSLDRIIAGLRCRDVLAVLADYVNEDLSPAVRDRVEQHLRGCDHCERFGSGYGSLVKQLRTRLMREAEADADAAISSRLNAYMDRVWNGRDT